MSANSKILIHSLVKLLVEQTISPEQKFWKTIESFQAMLRSFKEYGTWTNEEINHFVDRSEDLWDRVAMNPNDVVIHQSEKEFEDLLAAATKLADFKEQSGPPKLNKAPKPEAPKNAPYGQYLFAPNRTDLKHKVNEPNTPKEQSLLNQLQYHYDAGSNNLDKYAPEVINMINKGYYKKILAPPKKTVYRLLWNVNPKTAATLLNLDPEEITEQTNKPWYVEGGGTIKGNKGKNIQSWTTTMSTEWITDLMERDLRPNTVAIVLAAHTEGNNFFINPKGAEQVASLPTNLIKKEQEVISYGPVNFFEASFFYKTVGEAENKKQTDEALLFIRQIHELLIKEAEHIIKKFEEHVEELKRNANFYGSEIRQFEANIEDFQYLKATRKMIKNVAMKNNMSVWSLPANIRKQIFSIVTPTLGGGAGVPRIFHMYLETWKYGGPLSEKAIDDIRQKMAMFYQDVYDANQTKKSIVGIVSQLSKAMKFKLKK